MKRWRGNDNSENKGKKKKCVGSSSDQVKVKVPLLVPKVKALRKDRIRNKNLTKEMYRSLLS